VIGPGDEDLPSPDGHPSRFFMVAVRPGMVYSTGSTFIPVLQIDPIVPCDVTFTLIGPDGTRYVTEGRGDEFGTFAGKDRWIFDKPGVWTYTIDATWNGHKGRVPGLPDTGGYIFVMENTPEAEKRRLALDLAAEKVFSPVDGLEIRGTTTATKVFYAAITPGAVLEQGTLPVKEGEFQYLFNPQKISDRIKTYDTVNRVNGKPEIGRVVHLTFFAKEYGDDFSYHTFCRVILRGTTAYYVKGNQ
jgi:hypothetical protein